MTMNPDIEIKASPIQGKGLEMFGHFSIPETINIY
jgi:hypothetical protein